MHVVDVPAGTHAPPQPPICHPLEGLAVSVTVVPFENVSVSFVVLVFVVIPDGLELTLPEPLWLKFSVRGPLSFPLSRTLKDQGADQFPHSLGDPARTRQWYDPSPNPLSN